MVATAVTPRTELYSVTPDGTLRLHFHRGQWRAWQSTANVVAIVAGTQSGKTSFAPLWLWREIQSRGPGDYAMVTPTFPLLELKALPEFRRLFEDVLALGKYTGSPVRKFTFSPSGQRRMFGEPWATKTQVYFGYAQNPDSLESATYKGLVGDEAGQRMFKRESWEALTRRRSIHDARALIATTPYSNFGWLRTEIFDRFRAGDRRVDLIQFASIMNPAFPRAVYEEARAKLPRWKFDLFYRGVLTRPPGLIYDAFDAEAQTCPRFALPETWPRFLGLDFGGVNTVGVFYAQEPRTAKLYAYRTYKAGGLTARAHARALCAGEPMVPKCVGGSKGEDQWRDEFRAGGLPVLPPEISDVEVGINRVYGAHKEAQIVVFDDLDDYLGEKESYSRVVAPDGEPTEDIDEKSSYHHMDAERYIIGWLRRTPARRPTRWDGTVQYAP
jgi:hypothetical protein